MNGVAVIFDPSVVGYRVCHIPASAALARAALSHQPVIRGHQRVRCGGVRRYAAVNLLREYREYTLYVFYSIFKKTRPLRVLKRHHKQSLAGVSPQYFNKVSTLLSHWNSCPFYGISRLYKLQA